MRYLLSIILLSAIITSCTHDRRPQVRCTGEQMARMKPDSSVLTFPDMSRIVSIEADSLISNSEFDFMGIVEDISFIPLQTRADNLIGRPDRLILTDDHIYISDSKCVYIFDIKGRYVRKIPMRAGESHDFTFDRLWNELLICSGGMVSHYTADGRHTWSDLLPLQFSSIGCAGSTLIFYNDSIDANHHLPNVGGSQCIVMNRKGALLRHLAPRPYIPTGPNQTRHLTTSAECLLMTHGLCDTIFGVIDDHISARYVIKYPSHKVGQGLPPLGCGAYFFGGDAIACMGGIFFKLITDRAMTARFFYDARTGKAVGGIQPAADYCQMPPIFDPIASINDKYAALFHPYQTESGRTFRFVGDMINEREKDKLEDVRHGDNPVVTLYRVKIN